MPPLRKKHERNTESVRPMKNERVDPVDLSPVDPASVDPGYWDRFHHVVMTRAIAGLSRRRRAVPVSITDLILQWGRAAVPIAAAAAALAGLALMGEMTLSAPEPVALEELLSHDPDGTDLTGLFLANGTEAAQLAGVEW